MKETWRTLNSILGRNKKTKLPDFFNDKTGNKLKYPADIANNFNDFFTNIGPSLASKISPPDNDFVSPLTNLDVKDSILLNQTTPLEISDITSNLKSSNSIGHDDISTALLKSIIPEIDKVLSHIFNQSLITGIVPSKLKIAKVIPIYKAGDSHVFSNYRPISILPAISKILEKIVYVRLHDFIAKNSILSPHQYGFRPKYSTYMAINDLYTKITDDLDNKLHTIGLFLDLSKAFDTLDHQILLSKLDSYGVRGLANKWVENYLTDRKQYVYFKEESSLTSNHLRGTSRFNPRPPPVFIIHK